MLSIFVGTDLVEVARLRAALDARSPRLAERLFTEREWSYCQAQADPYASLAARFAAKEALRKIFGQWGYDDVIWRETEVIRTPRGVPTVRLHGVARERAGRHRFALSLSHTDTLAQAFCVAYGPPSHDE
jgi:holo-[acyl-carrier protein] synthase